MTKSSLMQTPEQEHILKQDDAYAFQQAVLQSVEQGVEFDVDRKFKWVNSAMCTMFGYTRDELLNQSTEIIYESSDVYNAVGEELKKQISEKGVYRSIVRTKRRSGELFECEIVGTPFNRNDLTKGWVGVFSDVTERRRNEQAQEKLTTLLQGIIDGSTQYSIIAADINGVIALFNRGAEQMLGYSAEEMVGKHTPMIFRDKIEIEKLAAEILNESGEILSGFDIIKYKARQKSLHDLEATYVKKDGTTILVLLSITSLYDSAGTLSGYLGIAKEITEEKKAKQQIEQFIDELQYSQQSLRELNAQKDKFLSIVSHDLRSPFNSILGFCELILDPEQQTSLEELQQYVGIIRQSAEQQIKLINNLLDWSRLETNRMPFHPHILRLHDVVQNVTDSLRGMALQKNIILSNDISLSSQVDADANMLHQLFQNLISNAVKFTPNGGRVHIGVQPLSSAMIEIRVRDTGIGIPAHKIEDLFRLDTKYFTMGTDGERGSGLGLLICKEIIDKHNGTIRVESEHGIGTSFIITLPMHRINEVLIVDDVLGDRILYKKYFEQLFPELYVLEASNGYEGLTIALEHHPSLVVLDYQMPIMNGLRFVEELTRIKEMHDIPVIVITGVDSQASKEALMKLGVRAFIEKPVSKHTFEKLIKMYASIQKDE